MTSILWPVCIKLVALYNRSRSIRLQESTCLSSSKPWHAPDLNLQTFTAAYMFFHLFFIEILQNFPAQSFLLPAPAFAREIMEFLASFLPTFSACVYLPHLITTDDVDSEQLWATWQPTCKLIKVTLRSDHCLPSNTSFLQRFVYVTAIPDLPAVASHSSSSSECEFYGNHLSWKAAFSTLSFFLLDWWWQSNR